MDRLRRTLFWTLFGLCVISAVLDVWAAPQPYLDPMFPLGGEGPLADYCYYRTAKTYVTFLILNAIALTAALVLGWRLRARWLGICVLGGALIVVPRVSEPLICGLLTP